MLSNVCHLLFPFWATCFFGVLLLGCLVCYPYFATDWATLRDGPLQTAQWITPGIKIRGVLNPGSGGHKQVTALIWLCKHGMQTRFMLWSEQIVWLHWGVSVWTSSHGWKTGLTWKGFGVMAGKFGVKQVIFSANLNRIYSGKVLETVTSSLGCFLYPSRDWSTA